MPVNRFVTVTLRTHRTSHDSRTWLLLFPSMYKEAEAMELKDLPQREQVYMRVSMYVFLQVSARRYL